MKDKPNWEKSSDTLVALFDVLTPQGPGIAMKKMFGWPCGFVNGNLFTGLHKQSMIFRLPDTDRTAFLDLGGTGDFEPMPGRKMKGYMVMADPLDRKRADLTHWLRRSLAFTRTLPEKIKKTPATKASRKQNR
jgi:hypothetical protein